MKYTKCKHAHTHHQWCWNFTLWAWSNSALRPAVIRFTAFTDVFCGEHTWWFSDMSVSQWLSSSFTTSVRCIHSISLWGMQQYGGELAQCTLDGATEYLYQSFCNSQLRWSELVRGLQVCLCGVGSSCWANSVVRPVVKLATFTDIFWWVVCDWVPGSPHQ